jgi:hypothetical protein
VIRPSLKARTPEELIALLSGVASAIIAAMIVRVLISAARFHSNSLGYFAELHIGAFGGTAAALAYPAWVGRGKRCPNRLRIHIRYEQPCLPLNRSN